MSQPLVVVPADDPVQIAHSPHLQRLREVTEVRLYNQFPADLTEQVQRAQSAEILLNSRGGLKWPATALRQLPRLRMITTCSIGVDSIDLAAARELGIVVSNVPGRTAEVVAEHALALMLGIARRLAFATATLKAGGWRIPDNTLLRGKMLGVVGTGAIGSEMIRLAKAIGMQVQAWTFHPSGERSQQRGVPFVELPQLLATSDVVSIHVKLTEQSRGLIGASEFNQMKPGSLLVNTARGAIVNSAALVAALEAGQLGGAALDVFDLEPLPVDSPLRSCEHVVLTPHSADQNPEGRELLNEGAVDNVLAFLSGRPQNVVT